MSDSVLLFFLPLSALQDDDTDEMRPGKRLGLRKTVEVSDRRGNKLPAKLRHNQLGQGLGQGPGWCVTGSKRAEDGGTGEQANDQLLGLSVWTDGSE